MDRLTKNERIQLEEVFAVIYTGRNSKFDSFKLYLRSKTIYILNKFRAKFKTKPQI